MTKQVLRKSISLLLLLVSLSAAQTSEVYIGTAVGRSVDEARSAALNSLIQQIQVVVSSNYQRKQIEKNTEYSDSTSISTMARSTMSLTDVSEKIEPLPDKTYRVIKIVAKESVRKMFADRKQKIFDHLREAQSIVFSKNVAAGISLHSALINYFQAYLLTILYPDTLSYPLGREHRYSSVMVGIPNTLDQIVSLLKFIPIKMIDDEYIVWKYRVEYAGVPVRSMRYSYFDGMGESDGEVIDGETQITLFYPRNEKKDRTISVNIDFLLESEMDDVLKMGYTSNAVSRLVKLLNVKVPGNAVIIEEGPTLPTQLGTFLEQDISAEKLKSELQRLSRKGVIVTAKATDFETLNGLYCLVVDRAGLKAFLKNERNRYYDFIGRSYRELKEFSGMTIIWMEYLQ